ncbi:MAG: hypothetical protein MI867_06665, partial [Pseudomonadales bacterium]|nr:hypothetical protein [Pseudomonadales bacterium]
MFAHHFLFVECGVELTVYRAFGGGCHFCPPVGIENRGWWAKSHDLPTTLPTIYGWIMVGVSGCLWNRKGKKINKYRLLRMAVDLGGFYSIFWICSRICS